MLAAGLAESNVSIGVSRRTDRPTTLAAAELDESGSATYRFYFEGTSAPIVEQVPLNPNVRLLHVGTLGLVLEPMASAVQVAIDHAPEQLLVFCDPNCRPHVIDERAVYLTRLGKVLARADIVKLSSDDLDWLAPGVDPVAAARQFVNVDRSVALVTAGGAMVHVLGPFGERTLPVPQVEVVDTVGAGDAFGGAFCAWWLHEGLHRPELSDPDLVEAATRYAVEVAAITCTRRGADPPRSPLSGESGARR